MAPSNKWIEVRGEATSGFPGQRGQTLPAGHSARRSLHTPPGCSEGGEIGVLVPPRAGAGTPTRCVSSSPTPITQKKLFNFPLQARGADHSVDSAKAGAEVFSDPTATRHGVPSVVGLSVCRLLCWHKRTPTGTCCCHTNVRPQARARRGQLSKANLVARCLFYWLQTDRSPRCCAGAGRIRTAYGERPRGISPTPLRGTEPLCRGLGLVPPFLYSSDSTALNLKNLL